jgi:C_GCAxxG_C_C family probable redox protein
MDESIQNKIREAGRRAVAYRHQGFHCSESTFLAINDVLKITDPSMVRIATGFHGGGGCHRIRPGVDMNAVLEGLASGRDRRTPAEAGLEITGHLCGALAAGIVCIGFLYGRRNPMDDLTCVDELSFELHKRFLQEFGEKECQEIRKKIIPQSPNGTCESVYERSAQIAVQLILEAPNLVKECAQRHYKF